jgi:transposase
MTSSLLAFDQLKQVFIVCGKTDLRKGIDGLASLIQSEYRLDPFTPALFLFCGGRLDRFKGLYWEGDGFILLYKRFENGHLQWPRNRQEVQQLSQRQLRQLLNGFTIEASIHPAQPSQLY